MFTHLNNKLILLLFLISFTWLIFVSLKNIHSLQSGFPTSIQYSILDGSKISVLGSTNINEFTCFSKEEYGDKKAVVYFNEMKNVMHFRDAVLEVTTVSLNCGNPAMNNNLYKTLNAEKFPFIVVELQQARSKDGKPLNNTNLNSMTASVMITLAGERRLNKISFTGKKSATGTYQFVGQHNLSLNDYHLEAPEALFGLIKVNDVITVRFELNVAANAVMVQ